VRKLNCNFLYQCNFTVSFDLLGVSLRRCDTQFKCYKYRDKFVSSLCRGAYQKGRLAVSDATGANEEGLQRLR